VHRAVQGRGKHAEERSALARPGRGESECNLVGRHLPVKHLLGIPARVGGSPQPRNAPLPTPRCGSAR